MEQQTETIAAIEEDETNGTIHSTHHLNGKPQNNQYLTHLKTIISAACLQSAKKNKSKARLPNSILILLQ
jgi:hypothetical protein